MIAPIYKQELFDICKEVANRFDGVTFSNNLFTVRIAKFARTQICAGFTFKYGVADMDPSIWVCFRKLGKLTAKYTGMGDCTSILNYEKIKYELIKFPKNKVGLTHIDRKIPAYALENEMYLKNYTLIQDVPELLESMVDDGVRILHKLYDFSSERNFLENMPPKYDPPPLDIPMPNYIGVPYTEYHRSAGIVMCLVRMSLGDFDFIDFYESDKFNPFAYKYEDMLQRLREDLPELKRRYEETGSIW
ncbi:hypothetical protein [Methylobacterium sp. J-076]|uniref:hypothetical protein n=1 Tax=Methylobacterium sp. J-076 TaxID=2836655 RepID=UPI001FB8A62F|nr:hypothetical protein [Methylobacterium sp. J-076]MCJ2013610.1 hypothetical protein [Methylobacterium sp. J-076]